MAQDSRFLDLFNDPGMVLSERAQNSGVPIVGPPIGGVTPKPPLDRTEAPKLETFVPKSFFPAVAPPRVGVRPPPSDDPIREIIRQVLGPVRQAPRDDGDIGKQPPPPVLLPPGPFEPPPGLPPGVITDPDPKPEPPDDITDTNPVKIIGDDGEVVDPADLINNTSFPGGTSLQKLLDAKIGGPSGGVSFERGESASFDSIFPPGVMDGLSELFQQLLSSPGIPEDVMNRAQGFNRSEILAQERRRIQRRGDDFSGRGLFGSGVHARDIRGIEADAEQEIGRSATALSLEDARLAKQGQQLAASLGLGMGDAGIDISRLNLAEGLGFGDLDLRNRGLEVEKAIREAELNFLIRSTFLGSGGETLGGGNAAATGLGVTARGSAREAAEGPNNIMDLLDSILGRAA